MTQIKTLQDLDNARYARKSVTCRNSVFKCTPAAFVMSLQGTVILRMIQRGLFIYEPKPKTKAPFKTEKIS